MPAKKSSAAAKSIAVTTTSPEVKNVPTKTAPRKVTKTVARMKIGDKAAFIAWLENAFPMLGGEGLITQREDGRYVATFDCPFTAALALAMIRCNSHNRGFKPHHAQLHAEKFRRPANEQEGFDDDISYCSVFISYDPDSGEMLVAAVSDGQHRAFGKLLADGSFLQIVTGLHYMRVHVANRDRDPEDLLPLDLVPVLAPVDYIDEETGILESGSLIPIDQWGAMVEEARTKTVEGKANSEMANLIPSIPFVGWTFREDIPTEELPPAREPMIRLSIGTHPRTLAKHDQDNLERSGADELDMSTETGPLLRGVMLPSSVAATWTRNHWLRVKPHTTTLDEDQNETVKRGTLGDGGKSLAPASYPAYFLSDRIGGQILSAWTEFKKVTDLHATMKDLDQNYPKHAKHPAHRALTDAQTVMSYDKPSNTVGGGTKIPEGIVQLAASLVHPLKKTKAAYTAEIADIILRLLYGITLDENGRYIPDTVFAPVRKWMKARRKDGGTWKSDQLLDEIAKAWNRHQTATNPKALESSAPNRFAGLDDTGISENDLKAIKAAQRGAEYIPGRKRGRPAVGIGNGTKKKPRKVN